MLTQGNMPSPRPAVFEWNSSDFGWVQAPSAFGAPNVADVHIGGWSVECTSAEMTSGQLRSLAVALNLAADALDGLNHA